MLCQLIAFQLYQMLVADTFTQRAVFNGFVQLFVPGFYYRFATAVFEQTTIEFSVKITGLDLLFIEQRKD